MAGNGGFTPSLKRTDVVLDGGASFLASEDYRVKRGGITVDSSTVAADEAGNKILKAGTFMAQITASGKYGPYAQGGVNEVQTVTITGSPTGGTFTLTWNGGTTAAIPYNATAKQVKDALEALDQIDPGDLVSVTKSGAVYTVTFAGGKDVAAMTTANAFTGGSSPATAVATTTAGGANDGRQAPDANTSGYLLNGINLKDGDVVTGLIIGGSVLTARVTPAPDSTTKTAVAGRIIFQ